MEKAIRNAVTAGMLAEVFIFFGLPTVHTRRMDDLWIAFVPIGKKERSVLSS